METKTIVCDKCRKTLDGINRYQLTIKKFEFEPESEFNSTPDLPFYPYGRDIDLCEDCYKKLDGYIL